MDFSSFESNTLEANQSLIVTASKRQARYLRELYQQQQIAQGKCAWQALTIMPWNAFLDKCWGLYRLTAKDTLPIRLNKAQSQHLWQTIVTSSKHTNDLLNVKQTIKLSFDAWRMLNQWQIKDFSFIHGDTDQEAFAEWYFEYKKQLSEHRWLDSYQIGSVLADKIGSYINQLPANIAFYGFQQITPQQKTIIDAIHFKKGQLELKQEVTNLFKRRVFSADTQDQELLSAVRWAIGRLETNREQSIAILVPDLEQQRSKIERAIQRELYPDEFLAGKTTHHWHDISVAENIEQQPMMEAVFLWLKLFDNSLNKPQLQTLLLTPYLYSTQEQSWQARQLELEIRKSNKEFYSLEAINLLSQKRELEFNWLSLINERLQSSDELKSISFKEFIQSVLSKLEALHWSGYQSLSSREFQLQQKLLEFIKAAVSLALVSNSKLNWSQALNLLQNFIQEQNFHQETPQAAIKVMGMLEAMTIGFDAIWMVGATDKLLPAKATINPFLSKALQLKYNLPGSSHQRELEYAEAVLASLQAQDELIFSYALHDEEQEQLLSPLLNPLVDEVGISPLSLATELPAYISDWPLSEVETYSDDNGLPLANDGYIAGGTGLLKAQAASPFDAYLRYRLNLYPLQTDDLGVSFMDRGNIFHKVMQIIWQHLKTQRALLNLLDTELHSLVDRTITTTLNIESKHLYLLNHQGFFESEQSRLKSLVLSALEFDKKRVAFEVIATEAKRQVEVGGLLLNISIDRIDQLDDGSLIIIDYKTGVPRLIDLMNDPIGEPQLLLYAISEHKESQPVAGVLFYQAHLKGSKYLGFTEASEMIPGVKALQDLANNPYSEQFELAIKQWRTMLNEIAESFKKGEAKLTDYSGNFADHYPVSRWLERDDEYQMAIQVLAEDSRS